MIKSLFHSYIRNFTFARVFLQKMHFRIKYFFIHGFKKSQIYRHSFYIYTAKAAFLQIRSNPINIHEETYFYRRSTFIFTVETRIFMGCARYFCCQALPVTLLQIFTAGLHISILVALYIQNLFLTKKRDQFLNLIRLDYHFFYDYFVFQESRK